MEKIRRKGRPAGIAVLLLIAGCTAARANGIIYDPSMAIERDSLSQALFQGSNFVPTDGGGGVFGFYNDTAMNITELMFEVNILANLDPAVVMQSFTCDSGNANPYFFYCSVQYVPTTGLLAISFWGTNPAPDPATVTPADEVGLHYGIPPLASGCAATPDGPGCTDVGHFALTLNSNFQLTGNDGGWNNTNSPGLFQQSGVTFVTQDISTVYGAAPVDLLAEVPEPANSGLTGAALLALGALLRRRYFPRSRS